jgi:hypothetical protein
VATVELTPLPVTRFANAVPGLLVLTLGALSAYGEGVPSVVTGGLVAAGAVVAVRGYRAGVTVTDRDVVIHGPVLTRTIARDLVDSISDWPAVIWRSPLPAPQHSRIVAFRTGSRARPAVRDHNAECVARLRRAVPPPRRPRS